MREKQGRLASVLTGILELSIMVGAGVAFGKWLIPLAYRLRGYSAFGGEWMAVLLISSAVYFTMHKWISRHVLTKPPAGEEDIQNRRCARLEERKIG